MERIDLNALVRELRIKRVEVNALHQLTSRIVQDPGELAGSVGGGTIVVSTGATETTGSGTTGVAS